MHPISNVQFKNSNSLKVNIMFQWKFLHATLPFFQLWQYCLNNLNIRDVDFVSKKNCKWGQKIIINILLLLSRKSGLSTGPKTRRNPSVIFLHKSSYLNVINWFTLFNSTITLTFLIELYTAAIPYQPYIYTAQAAENVFILSV